MVFMRAKLRLPGGGCFSNPDRISFDLELIESRTLDGHIQELVYRPTLNV
jgi:hypothetical protein